jgi:single-stranded-DNA-specific exonuclease
LNKIEREIDFDKQKVIVLHQDGWHLGVIGIVAAKLAERFCRPALVISLDEKDGRGSARSIDSFHIVEALNECSRFLRDFGGHKRAAGFSIEKDNIASFKNSINKFAQSIIKEENLIPVLNIDAEIPLCEADDKLFLGINELVPFGEGNPEPVFCSRGLTLKAKPQQLAKDTLKLLLTDGKATISAVGFGLASLASLIQDNSRIDIAYTVSKDTWQGRNNIVLKIKDLQAF